MSAAIEWFVSAVVVMAAVAAGVAACVWDIARRRRASGVAVGEQP